VAGKVRITASTALVLMALARQYMYGFDIADVTGLPSGTVYPILRRLEDAGLLRSRWEAVQQARAEQRPPRRYYTLTGAGASSARAAAERFAALAAVFARPTAGPRPVTA
jgi:PadR family transcriptional regulator PadR